MGNQKFVTLDEETFWTSQQHVILDEEMLRKLRSPKNKWRDCQRKQYSVFAIQPAAGYVFANRLEQPLSYKKIISKYGKAVVWHGMLDKKTAEFLRANGCYMTDGTKVVLCGTKGELWTVKPADLVKYYTNMDGSPVTEIPKSWVSFRRAPESSPFAKGIQVPLDFLAEYHTMWGDVLKMNDLNSGGHYTGDILVKGFSGIVSPTNNEVFALTYNLNVGGWANSGLITPVEDIKKLSIDVVKELYYFG